MSLFPQSLRELDMRSAYILTGLVLAKFTVTSSNLPPDMQWALLLGLVVANSVFIASLYPTVVAAVVGKYSPYTYRVRHVGLVVVRLYALAMIHQGDVRDLRPSMTSDDPVRILGLSTRRIIDMLLPKVYPSVTPNDAGGFE